MSPAKIAGMLVAVAVLGVLFIYFQSQSGTWTNQVWDLLMDTIKSWTNAGTVGGGGGGTP